MKGVNLFKRTQFNGNELNSLERGLILIERKSISIERGRSSIPWPGVPWENIIPWYIFPEIVTSGLRKTTAHRYHRDRYNLHSYVFLSFLRKYGGLLKTCRIIKGHAFDPVLHVSITKHIPTPP